MATRMLLFAAYAMGTVVPSLLRNDSKFSRFQECRTDIIVGIQRASLHCTHRASPNNDHTQYFGENLDLQQLPIWTVESDLSVHKMSCIGCCLPNNCLPSLSFTKIRHRFKFTWSFRVFHECACAKQWNSKIFTK